MTSNATQIFNISLEEYLRQERGSPQLPLETAVLMTILDVILLLSGFLGNVAVCVVIVRHPAMHTATNYYLFNLAVSDLILLIFGLPYEVVLCWHQYPWVLGEFICKMRTLVSEMASYVSVLTIVAFSTERYLAICYPLYLYAMAGLQRAVRIIACLWLVAFLSATPFAVYTGVNYLQYPPDSDNLLEESAFCGMFSQPFPLAEISTIVFFIIPMLVIAIQYTKMGLQISKSTRRTLGKGLNGSVHRDSRNSQSNRTIIRMLAAVVVGFFVCWAPFHAQRLLAIIYKEKEVSEWVYFLTGILYYLSSTLNPIFYNIMSDRYRIAFKEILCGVKSRRGGLMRSSTFRETTRIVSQTDVQLSRSLYHVRMDKCEKNGGVDAVKDEDRLQLVDQEIITVSTPKTGSTLIYEINFQDKCELLAGKDNCETCI